MDLTTRSPWQPTASPGLHLNGKDVNYTLVQDIYSRMETYYHDKNRLLDSMPLCIYSELPLTWVGRKWKMLTPETDTCERLNSNNKRYRDRCEWEKRATAQIRYMAVGLAEDKCHCENVVEGEYVGDFEKCWKGGHKDERVGCSEKEIGKAIKIWKEMYDLDMSFCNNELLMLGVFDRDGYNITDDSGQGYYHPSATEVGWKQAFYDFITEGFLPSSARAQLPTSTEKNPGEEETKATEPPAVVESKPTLFGQSESKDRGKPNSSAGVSSIKLGAKKLLLFTLGISPIILMTWFA